MKLVNHQTTLHLSFKIKCCVDRLRPPFVTGHDGVCQNMTGRSQRFQSSRGNVRQFRPFFIGYYLIARTKVKVETSHFDLPIKWGDSTSSVPALSVRRLTQKQMDQSPRQPARQRRDRPGRLRRRERRKACLHLKRHCWMQVCTKACINWPLETGGPSRRCRTGQEAARAAF
jgi:hypothetical protein